MTDLEITKLCAEAMGIDVRLGTYRGTIRRYYHWDANVEREYNPLHDDAQAMALVKKFRLDITNFFGADDDFHEWRVRGTVDGWETSGDESLNRAICECVAKMQAAK